MASVTVIGGSGFLGSHLIPPLLNSGHRIKVIDQIPADNASKIQEHLSNPNLSYSWKSILDIDTPLDDDFVIHLASISDIPFALGSPMQTYLQNVLGTLALLRHLTDNVKLFVYTSSENVYGRVSPDRIPVGEEECLRPVEPYAASKAAADLLCQSWNRAYGTPTTILRLATIFGERMRLTQVVPIFVRRALQNQPIEIEGDGSQTRDLNYVANTVNAIVRTIERPKKSAGEVYNIGYGRETSILELAESIIELCESSSKINFRAWRPGERGLRLAMSTEKARRDLEYEPEVSTNEGLVRTIKWLRPR